MKNASAHYESSILFPCAVMAGKLLKLLLDEHLLLHRFGSKSKHLNLLKGRFKCFCSDTFSGKLRDPWEVKGPCQFFRRQHEKTVY